jgi:hypothetical protein
MPLFCVDKENTNVIYITQKQGKNVCKNQPFFVQCMKNPQKRTDWHGYIHNNVRYWPVCLIKTSSNQLVLTWPMPKRTMLNT